MAQRITQINVLWGEGTVQIEIYGENGSELIYSGNGETEIRQMFTDMCGNLRRDMDGCGMVLAGSVPQEFSDGNNESDFSDVIDDLYLGNLSDSVQDWCDWLWDQANDGPVAYVSAISVELLPDNRQIAIDLYWDSSDPNWDKYGLREPNGFFPYVSAEDKPIGALAHDIASDWARKLVEFGIAYDRAPELVLPEFGPDVDVDVVSEAFYDLSEGNCTSSNVQALNSYLDELRKSSVPGAYIETVELGVDPNNDASLLMRVVWNTYDNPEWNAIVPSEWQGERKYYSEDYGSIEDMFEALARELEPSLAPEGIDYNPDIVEIYFPPTEGPVITESELNNALNDLFHGYSRTAYIFPVIDKLQQMLDDHQGYPITSIVYNINDSGGDITFIADGFEASYSIYDKESLLDAFSEIAENLAPNCENSHVFFDSEIKVDIEPGYNNSIDIARSGYGYDELYDIFYNLYDGNVTDSAERLANWVASM